MSTMVPMYGFGGGGGTGASLTVNAPAGCTVTVSKDGKTKTKTAGADGVAVFKGLATGEWTVTITDGEQIYDKTVTVTVDYETAITFFAATIHISYPAGSTCTATDGVTTLTAPDTSGTWDIELSEPGTWTVSLSNGFKEQVFISENGEEKTVDRWHLYNDGDERNYITGGWTANNVSISTGVSVNALNIAKNESNMVLSQSATQRCAAISTDKPVDLTGYETIFCDVTFNKSTTGAWCLLSAHPNRGTTRVNCEVEAVSGEQILKLNVSAVNEARYISFGMYHPCNMTVRKVWLE